MTRKERFMKIIKDRGYDSVVNLMIKVESIILGDRGKAIEVAQKNKNYYAMIEGKDREFPPKYIKALEKVLNMKFVDMINPDSTGKAELNYDTLRTVAFSNDYNKAKEFDCINSNEGTSIYEKEDEFGNYFIDYIIEYSSKKSFEYLLENNNFKMLPSCVFDYYYTNDFKSLPSRLLRFVCHEDDEIIFNRLFDTKKFIRMSLYTDYNIYEDEEFVRPILSTKKVLDSLFKKVSISIDEINNINSNVIMNDGLFSNIMINTLLKLALKNPIENEKIIIRILKESYHLNKEIVNYLKKFNYEYKINEKGVVTTNRLIVGSVIKYDFVLMPDTSDSIRKELDNLSNSILELEEKNISSEGRKKYQVIDGKLYIEASNNEIEYDMLKYMNGNKFTKVPTLLAHNIEKNIDVLEYKEPYMQRVLYGEDIINKIKEIALFLKDFHALSKQKLVENVYLHNNLTLENISIVNNKINAVIDWSNCSIGNPLDDILFVLIKWTNMEERYRVNDVVLKGIYSFVDIYNLDKNIKLGDELNFYLDNKLKSLDIKSRNYEINYEKLKFAQIFVDLYKDKLNERK